MGGLFSTPKAPAVSVPEPVVMPEADSEKVLAAKKKKAAEISTRSGRSSTIMTELTDRLGG